MRLMRDRGKKVIYNPLSTNCCSQIQILELYICPLAIFWKDDKCMIYDGMYDMI